MNNDLVVQAIQNIKQGKMVIVVDDRHRENEGDLIMAAELVTPTAINFMITYGRGLVCLAITRERAKFLKLPPMVAANTAAYHTNFTVSIDAASGITTGISAPDRARTILTAVDPVSKPEDLCQPGHLFPLVAAVGGFKERQGHTEAAVALAELAGCAPAGVLCEVLDDHGNSANQEYLVAFARQHNLLILSIAELIVFKNK